MAAAVMIATPGSGMGEMKRLRQLPSELRQLLDIS
jgi:hypothetical protein